MTKMPELQNGGTVKAVMEFSDPFETQARPEPITTVCPQCHQELDLMQPDSNLSEALLGVCTGCPAWYLIDAQNGTVSDLGISRLLDR
jgi:hypothetical protein